MDSIEVAEGYEDPYIKAKKRIITQAGETQWLQLEHLLDMYPTGRDKEAQVRLLSTGTGSAESWDRALNDFEKRFEDLTQDERGRTNRAESDALQRWKSWREKFGKA